MVLNISRAARIALVLAVEASVGLAQRPEWNLRPTANARPLLYGFALECVDCQPGEGARGRSGGGGAPPAVMSYRSFPRVSAVAPGSAAEAAGVRAGDVLLSIDGLSILTESGAQRFARAVAGEQVRLGFERDAKPIAVPLVLGAVAAGSSGPRKVISGYLTLNGHVNGDIGIEIWSNDQILLQDSTDSVVLRIGTGTIVKLSRKRGSADTTSSAAGRGKKPES